MVKVPYYFSYGLLESSGKMQPKSKIILIAPNSKSKNNGVTAFILFLEQNFRAVNAKWKILWK